MNNAGVNNGNGNNVQRRELQKYSDGNGYYVAPNEGGNGRYQN